MYPQSNGNLLTDSGKGVTGITYNYLNLPQQITTATGTITYSYTATGQKLRMTTSAKTYDYVGSLVYENSTLEFIATAEGRVLPPDKAVNPELLPLTTVLLKNSYYRYEYQLKDHLGNLRVACRCAEKAFKISPADTYPVIAVQENHYDAWGLSLPLTEQNANLAGSPEHRWQYNGKEKVPDLGWYEYGFRWYASDRARFLQVDPLAENHFDYTPFAYVLNNPVAYIDPMGLDTLSSKTKGFSWDNVKGGDVVDGVSVLNEVKVTPKNGVVYKDKKEYLQVNYPNSWHLYYTSDSRYRPYGLDDTFDIMGFQWQYSISFGPANYYGAIGWARTKYESGLYVSWPMLIMNTASKSAMSSPPRLPSLKEGVSFSIFAGKFIGEKQNMSLSSNFGGWSVSGSGQYGLGGGVSTGQAFEAYKNGNSYFNTPKERFVTGSVLFGAGAGLGAEVNYTKFLWLSKSGWQ